VCLRPVAVWDEAGYSRVQDRWRAQPRSEWEPFWEYGAFVDVRDVAAAALTVPLAGHHRAPLCAADIGATAPSLQLATRLAPACRSPTRAATAPIRGPPSSIAQPPPPRSAGGPPTDGHGTGRTDTPSHKTPRGR